MKLDGREVHLLVEGGHAVEFHEVVNVVEEFRVKAVVDAVEVVVKMVVNVDQGEVLQYAEEELHDAMDVDVDADAGVQRRGLVYAAGDGEVDPVMDGHCTTDVIGQPTRAGEVQTVSERVL